MFKRRCIKKKCKNNIISKTQINELTDEIKDEYLKTEYNGKNNIIETANVVFQVTTLENQTDTYYSDISNVELGSCKETLKEYYRIPEEESLIIFKTEIKTSISIQSFTQYEIYNPLNLEKLNLSICNKTKITISSKINLDNSSFSLFDSLKKSG